MTSKIALTPRRFLGGRQPLCGIGVTSSILVIFRPQPFKARTADSRPGPGPMTRTSTFFTPCSCAAVPARSAATCAANGVDLREPRKPQPPDVAQDSVLPCRSVIVMIVLLNDACTCAIASSTFLRAFLGFLAPPAPVCCCDVFGSAISVVACLQSQGPMGTGVGQLGA